MNVFEDLLGELKEEALLEDTVIKIDSQSPESLVSAADPDDYVETDSRYKTDLDASDDPTADNYLRKRAADEVAAMQMVEHVLAGIEREHYKAKPALYDDLEAKKALHRFTQVSDSPGTPEYAEAETALLAETHAWSSALHTRDEAISLETMRAFCENCRPVLSSQALLALSRFYRNAPYSEANRQKFEYVMTRLFTREVEDHKRKLLFDRQEMVGHIRNLYAKWSSLSMLDAGEEVTAIEAIVRSFADCVQRSRAAGDLDELIETELFENLNALTPSTEELFFEPRVVTAAIECNVRVGNRLLDLAKQGPTRATLRQSLDDPESELPTAMCGAVGRTLGPAELLEYVTLQTAPKEGDEVAPNEISSRTESAAAVEPKPRVRANRWLVYLTLLVLAVSGGLYLWADRAAAPDASTSQANKVDLGSTDLAPYLRTGRATTTTFYAITLPTWDTLSEEQKKDVVKRSLLLGEKLKVGRVELLNYKGRTVAVGSQNKIDLVEPHEP
jgi:hypothetical protein